MNRSKHKNNNLSSTLYIASRLILVLLTLLLFNFLMSSCKSSKTVLNDSILHETDSGLVMSGGNFSKEDFFLDTELNPDHYIVSINRRPSIILSNDSTYLEFRFNNDSLLVSGDMKLDQASKMFIEHCSKYYTTKVDSLKDQIEKLKNCYEPKKYRKN